MVAQNVFHKASPRQITDLWRFADRCCIPWNLPTNLHSDLIATIQQKVPTFSLRTALSAIPFVSDLFGVDVQWFQERSSQALPNSKELSVKMTLGFLSGSKNFCKLLCVSWEVFVLHGYALDPLSGQVLHHDCISVTVSRFTTFTENFVICCYQITKIFSTKCGCTLSSSARSPCNFRPFADLAISVSREVS